MKKKNANKMADIVMSVDVNVNDVRLSGGREIRCTEVAELRATPPTGDAPGKLHGYAAVYNTLSQPLPIEGSDGKRTMFRERIAPGAFVRALSPTADVRALVNHEADQLIGRTTSKTLRMKDDDHGLYFEVDVPNTRAGQDALISVERGDMNGCSFGFRTIRDSWSRENGEAIRTLLELDVLDVGPVTFPAYADTSVDVRSVREGLSKLDPPAAVIKPTVDELRAKMKTTFDGELRALMEYDDPSLIWACRCAIQYFRNAFDCAQSVMDTVAAVAGELTEQDQQAVDDCMDVVSDLIAKARDCKSALQLIGAVDEDQVAADGEMRMRITELAKRGLPIPESLRAKAAV